MLKQIYEFFFFFFCFFCFFAFTSEHYLHANLSSRLHYNVRHSFSLLPHPPLPPETRATSIFLPPPSLPPGVCVSLRRANSRLKNAPNKSLFLPPYLPPSSSFPICLALLLKRVGGGEACMRKTFPHRYIVPVTREKIIALFSIKYRIRNLFLNLHAITRRY